MWLPVWKRTKPFVKRIGVISVISGYISSINVNPNGGVPKFPVESTRLLFGGVEGDRQNDLKYHGGPERAVCIYSLELIDALINEGHTINEGAVGENLTISGIDWSMLNSGSILSIGESMIEITSPATPCKTISHVFSDSFFSRISEKKFPGWSRWYARVKIEGIVSKGDSVKLIDGED